MKTLQELEEIRNKALAALNTRTSGNETRIVVGMATCGISAGGRPVLKEFMEQLKVRGITDVEVGQTGCIGLCSLEPIVEVYKPGQEKVTYGKVNVDVARRIIAEHIVNGNIVEEYTVGNLEEKSF